jgi:signal peptidase
MATRNKPKKSESLLTQLRESDDTPFSIARDIIWVIGVVGGIALLLFLVSGTWPAVVAVESESMVPNMQVGDLVFVVAPDRFGDLTTWEEGEQTGYARFAAFPDLGGNIPYGDVIIYQPNGVSTVHPIIHRALYWYEGEPHDGYITKGDNNPVSDQDGYYTGIGAIEPVKKEWVIGKALFAIPYIGYIPLHIVEFAVLIIFLILVHEYIIRRKDMNEGQKKKKSKKGR